MNTFNVACKHFHNIKPGSLANSRMMRFTAMETSAAFEVDETISAKAV